jgi:hypothetical protein
MEDAMKISVRNALLTALAVLVFTPTVWAFDPTFVIYAGPPSGGTGSVAASGTFAIEPGATLDSLEIRALNQNDTLPGGSKILVSGTDYNPTNGTWNVTLTLSPKSYQVSKINYNTPITAPTVMN